MGECSPTVRRAAFSTLSFKTTNRWAHEHRGLCKGICARRLRRECHRSRAGTEAGPKILSMCDTLESQLKEIEERIRQGDPDVVLRMDEVAASYPEVAAIWTLRAHFHSQQSNSAAAVADWSKAISICNKEPHYYYMRGIALFRMSEYDRAVLDFTTVIEFCDLHQSDYYREPAYFFRADALVRIRRYEEAKSDCQHISDSMTTWTDKLRTKADILRECS